MFSKCRKYLRTVSRLGSVALLAAAAACSDMPTAPSATPATAPSSADPSLLGGLFGGIGGVADELLFCPQSQTYSATQTVGSSGGTIVVGPHSLSIPYGALSEPVTITATAPAGDHVRVEFQPHGLTFDYNATLRLSYQDCGLLTVLTARIVYLDDALNILEQIPSTNDIWRQRVSGRIRHFSSYALAF